MQNPSRALLSLFALILALAFVAGCGDDDSSSGTVSEDTDPQEVLDTALGGEQSVDSGVLDVSFELSVEGSEAGTIDASLTGPFQSGEDETSLPEVDLTASASADAADTDFSFDGGLTLTDDAAYITYNDTAYELDQATYDLVAQSYEQSAAQQSEGGETGSLAQFGVDPASWVTDLTNEGTEDIDGDEVIHITGTGDVNAIVDDLTSIAEQTGQAAQLDSAGLSQFEELVENATIDVYANAEDDSLRQLDLTMDIADPAGEGTASMTFSIGIADPNSEQDISAPEDPQPISGLLDQIPGGVGGLGALGGLSGGSTGATGLPSGGGSQDFYDCVAQAQSAADLDACGTP